MREQELIVEPSGEIRFVYDDELAELVREVGPVEVRRASHVEPDDIWTGFWTADLRPAGGVLAAGFETRRAALDFEVRWLSEHGIPFPEEGR